MATSMLQFTANDCRAALKDVLDAFTQVENATRLDEARDNAGNDMLKIMQTVFPMATQIEMEIIEKYGFPGNGEGLIRFSQTVKAFEKQDPEIAQLNAKVRTFLIPTISIPPPSETAESIAT